MTRPSTMLRRKRSASHVGAPRRSNFDTMTASKETVNPPVRQIAAIKAPAAPAISPAGPGSCKAQNLRRDPRVAFVIGWDLGSDERTVQYEGIADEPAGDELARVKAAYFEAFPDGRDRENGPGITYFRARPTWIRYSDFS